MTTPAKTTPDISRHPCFNEGSRHNFGRVHLPVAPKCNVQCNYCNRRYDCANETRPGVTSAVLSPEQALAYLNELVRRDGRLAVVGIAGPGDPFANPERTMGALRLVREAYPEMLLCVSTNGLNIAPYIDELAELGVSHVTLTINAIDADIARQVYAWVRDGVKIHRGRSGAELMIERQLEAVRLLKARNIIVKVNTIVIPGVNEDHVAAVAETVASLGADLLNCMPMCPVAGTPLESAGEPGDELMAAARLAAERFLPQMRHCTRCRADAAGLLGEPMSVETAELLRRSAATPPRLDASKPCVAVTSMEGLLVNQHLGQAGALMIFREAPNGEGFIHIEDRPAPPPGGAEQRWSALAGVLHDCRAVLTASAGARPKARLADDGIRVLEVEGLIESALDAVFNNRPLRCASRAGCGSGCAGDGMGCG